MNRITTDWKFHLLIGCTDFYYSFRGTHSRMSWGRCSVGLFFMSKLFYFFLFPCNSINILNSTGSHCHHLRCDRPAGSRDRFSHQLAGQHLNRDQAIYWDGRSKNGETVASGTYFYRLQVRLKSQTGTTAKPEKW